MLFFSCLKKQGFACFLLDCVVYFGVFLWICVKLFLFHIPCDHKHPLLSHYFPLWCFLAPVSFVTEFLLFSALDHALEIMTYSPICSSFCLVFASPRMNASTYTQPNPCTPIRNALCMFFWFVAKHDVRGNFPDHITPNHGLRDPKCVILALFLCPSCPLRPTAPIRTHPHPITPVCTRLHPKLQCI